MTEIIMDESVARALRALAISGRRLLRRREGDWGVHRVNDRRRRPLARLGQDIVERMTREGRLIEAGDGSFVLAMQDRTQGPTEPPPRWVFIASGARRPGRRSGGIGFAGLATLAQEGRGPLSLRQVLAGLRLVRDAEQAASDARLTMNWDSGPVTRQRRSGTAPGVGGDALRASRDLLALRETLGEPAWRFLWSMCVDADSLRALMRRFGMQSREIHTAAADALERLAEVYDG
jgi:hypothetical protein